MNACHCFSGWNTIQMIRITSDPSNPLENISLNISTPSDTPIFSPPLDESSSLLSSPQLRPSVVVTPFLSFTPLQSSILETLPSGSSSLVVVGAAGGTLPLLLLCRRVHLSLSQEGHGSISLSVCYGVVCILHISKKKDRRRLRIHISEFANSYGIPRGGAARGKAAGPFSSRGSGRAWARELCGRRGTR